MSQSKRLLMSLLFLLLAIGSNIVASSTVNTERVLNRYYAHLSPMASSDMGWAATRGLGLSGSAVGPAIEACFAIVSVGALIVVLWSLDLRESICSSMLILSIALYARTLLCMSNYSGPLVGPMRAVSQYSLLPELLRFSHGPALSILLSTFALLMLVLLFTNYPGYILLSLLVAFIPAATAIASHSQRTCDVVSSMLLGAAAAWLLYLKGTGGFFIAGGISLFVWLFFLPIALYVTPSQQAFSSEFDKS